MCCVCCVHVLLPVYQCMYLAGTVVFVCKYFFRLLSTLHATVFPIILSGLASATLQTCKANKYAQLVLNALTDAIP